MSLSDINLTILHVEDDPFQAKLVESAFRSLGFRGRMIRAGGLGEAVDVLGACSRQGEEINLILVDMQLPDGTGLDLIREVKSDPVWQVMPVVVLSSETGSHTVNSSYALGANCYLPKLPKQGSSYNVFRSLYECWIKGAFLPRRSCRDRVKIVLATAVRIRARFAGLYTKLAAVCAEAEEEQFWLDRAFTEGNLSNLLAFFQRRVTEEDLPPEKVDRLAGMQIRTKRTVAAIEARLRRKPAPDPSDLSRWILDCADALDEELFAEIVGDLFPKGPAAATALKARAASQLGELGRYILARTDSADIRQRAENLVSWGGRFSGDVPDPGERTA